MLRFVFSLSGILKYQKRKLDALLALTKEKLKIDWHNLLKSNIQSCNTKNGNKQR